jgi:hypothetical protein
MFRATNDGEGSMKRAWSVEDGSKMRSKVDDRPISSAFPRGFDTRFRIAGGPFLAAGFTRSAENRTGMCLVSQIETIISRTR